MTLIELQDILGTRIEIATNKNMSLEERRKKLKSFRPSRRLPSK